jgi:exopolyphosphatase/guanosine-5'-triphosphate,3'-diphosphate pyrophosphatase
MNNLRRVAVIDCGTNTFNLRIVDLGAASGWIPVFGQRIPVKLGQGGVAKGVIRPDRIARGLDALVSMREAIRNYRAEEVHVMATSAMRDAKNGRDFVDQAKALTGFEIQVISGQHEARLIQEGIRLNFQEPPMETCLTMDIGGGSVEFIVWDAEGIKWAQSFDTGVARLQMLMNLPDPIGSKGVASMRPYFDDAMAPLAAAIAALKPAMLVGASGSFDTVAELVGTRTRVERPDHAQSPEPHPDADPIPVEAWADVCAQLTERDAHYRTNMPGMDPARVDLMPYSAALIQWVLDQGTVTSICRAPYALREGVLSRIEQGLPLLPEL